MIRLELHDRLDQPTLDHILALVGESERIEGHPPVGEHKASHLAVGARNWVGILAFDDDRLVGYAHTRWNAPQAHPRLAVEIVVHPDWYDSHVARHLLDETRAVLGRAGGGLLYLWVHRVQDPDQTLARQMGFEVQRELLYMTRPLQAVPPAHLPAGVEVRPYSGDVDDAEFLRVNNAAFKGHPENGGWSSEDFTERRSLHWFDPEGLLMAWRGDRLAGFHWTKWHSHESDQDPAHAPEGEVYVLAVDPDAHGGGLGRALLRAGLAHLHTKGCRRAVLYVDAASESAVALYESEEFTARYRDVCYQEDVWPIVDYSTSDLLRPAS